MRPLKYIPHYTVSDYNLWEGSWELIDGLPYSMSPSPVRRHQQLAALFTHQLVSSVEKQKKCSNCIVVHELDWIIDNTTVVRPDIAIICNEKGDFISSPPVLIVEILSPATAFKDRQVKFDIYQEQGVKWYIIADTETKTYSIYLLSGKVYREQTAIETFAIHGSCKVQLDIEKALARLA
jgi:Uma2 family endonuclease